MYPSLMMKLCKVTQDQVLAQQQFTYFHGACSPIFSHVKYQKTTNTVAAQRITFLLVC